MLREMLGRGALTPALERVVQRCLAREPDDRWHSAGDLKAALEMIAAAPRVHLPQWAPRAAAGAAVLAGLAALAVYWQPFKHEPSRLTIDAPGASIAGRLSVSPDGGRVAFTRSGRVWVRALNRSESYSVDGTDGAGTPFWSPDGKHLAFAAGKTLYTVPVAGGVPHALCGVNTSLAGAWGPGGDILIGQIGDGILRIPESGGAPVRITRPDPMKNETRHLLPQFLPGGRRFLYVAGSDRPGYSVLWAASLDNPERKAIMNVESGVSVAAQRQGSLAYLVFLRDHALVAERFDVNALELVGTARMLAPAVGSVPSSGSAAVIGDFAAAGGTLAYRQGAGGNGVLALVNAMIPRSEITVLRNWM
jgi:hypothetical protein